MKSLVLGVGNTLRGDDGFGPTVIEKLQEEVSDPNAEILDVGTSLSLVLWPYIWEEDPPERIIIVDVVVDGKSGLRELDIGDVPSQFFLQSSHLFPPRELLESLRKRGIEITVFVCSVKNISDEVTDVMTEETRNQVDGAVRRIKKLLADSANAQTIDSQEKGG